MKIGTFKLGMFILAALLLFLAVVFFLGASDIFVKKARITALFSESVQGLAVGSAVKYKGVPVGNVGRIAIEADSKTIVVDMDIDLATFRRNAAARSTYDSQEDFEEFLTREIVDGLRCRLEMSGVTGMKFIEMDYFVPAGTPHALQQSAGYDNFIVPTAPSVMQDLIKSVSTSLDRISRIRFEEISDTLVQNLSDLNRFFSAPEAREALRSIRSLTHNLDQTSDSLNSVLTRERIDRIVTLVEKNMNEIAGLAGKLGGELEQAGFGETIVAVRGSANDLGSAARSISDRRESIAVSMDKLIQTLDSLRELLDYLNRDPSALLRGKQAPPGPERR